jgi:hypothetical protein
MKKKDSFICRTDNEIKQTKEEMKSFQRNKKNTLFM